MAQEAYFGPLISFINFSDLIKLQTNTIPAKIFVHTVIYTLSIRKLYPSQMAEYQQ